MGRVWSWIGGGGRHFWFGIRRKERNENGNWDVGEGMMDGWLSSLILYYSKRIVIDVADLSMI